MADEPDEVRLPEDEEDGGGAVKSFLDHLEDLRWVLIKSTVAVTIGMILCLAAGNWLMEVLKWPLQRSILPSSDTNQFLSLKFGTNRLGVVSLGTNRLDAFGLGTNQHLTVKLVPLQLGTNLLAALAITTNDPADFRARKQVTLLNLAPAGGFLVAFQIAIYGGIVLSSPFIIYYIAQFVLPALKRKEKKYLFRGMLIGTGLFFTGVFFCYFILAPLALNASRLYSEWLGIGADQWTAEQYISFLCKFMLGMGLGFELPVVVLTLVRIGILDYQKLASFRRYMVVLCLVLGAVLTTPEVLTQIMMAGPLYLLYEISIWIAWYWEWKEKKRQMALTFVDNADEPPDKIQ